MGFAFKRNSNPSEVNLQDPSSQEAVNWFVTSNHSGCGPSRSKKEKQERKRFYTGLGEESFLCGSRVVALGCERFLHNYGKRCYCGRSWCPRCGKDESKMHKRRYGRLMSKVFYLGNAGKSHGLGYWVFTVPLEVRKKLGRKGNLKRAGRVCRDILKQHGFDIGISGWHFFGDGQIKEGELDLGVFHPHENALVIGRWVHDWEMQKIKDEWRKYLETLLGESIGVVDVWYQYFKDKGQWWHKGTYITRPTFKSLDFGNYFLADELFNFRNVVSWGFGQGEKRKEKEAQGLAVLKNWIQELEEKNKEKKEKEDLALKLLISMFCSECFALDGRLIRLVAKRDQYDVPLVFDYGWLEYFSLIRGEYGEGFFALNPFFELVMFTLKPMSGDWFCNFSFDTS